MNKIATLVFTLSLGLLALNTHAANPNPKPNCPLGKIAVLEGNLWQCKEPGLSAGDHNPQPAALLLPAVQKAREAAPASGAQVQPAGTRPSCPKGQIAKLEMGQWQCKAMELSDRPQQPRAGYMKFDGVEGESRHAPAAGSRPQCRKGELPKLENGQWRCRTPDLAAPAKPER